MSQYIFKLPDLGEGTVEAEIAEWHIKLGDQVTEEDVLGAMMTDKAAVEVSSPVSGVVTALAGEPGDIVAVGAPLVTFETDADAAPAAASEKPAAAPVADPPKPDPAKSPEASVPAPIAENHKVQASPAIRRMAREAGIQLSHVAGTGPRGRITRADFDAFLAGGQTSAKQSSKRTGTEEIKVIGIRRMIAEKMSASKREIPHFTYVEEVDITELEALRAHLNAQSPATRLTLLPFIATAIIRATVKFPQANAVYDAERNVIVRHNGVHLGVATQTDSGLKVPVVHHAEALELMQLAGEIGRVTQAARDNSASKKELTGSTITLTSLGKLGGIVSTPVINAPEVGIIGVNKAVQRPVIRNAQVEARLMMNLSSSFDHRFVDGFDAAEMIQDIKAMLEHPATLFI
ncbi:MAG: dihydrolipoamide acetyltransferase family protein [Pseudomonadota bacterium]